MVAALWDRFAWWQPEGLLANGDALTMVLVRGGRRSGGQPGWGFNRSFFETPMDLAFGWRCPKQGDCRCECDGLPFALWGQQVQPRMA
eukprot:6304532-Prorocentrum_lima.AAC.1